MKDRKLQAAKMKVLRRVRGITRLDCVRNEDIKERLKKEAVVEHIKRRIEAWRAMVMDSVMVA